MAHKLVQLVQFKSHIMGGTITTNARNVLLCYMLTICLPVLSEGSKPNKATIGRIGKDSTCNSLYSTTINNKYIIETDGYIISPPCHVDLIGLKVTNKTQEYDNLCYTITEMNIPCGSNNSISINMVPLRENHTTLNAGTTYRCHDSVSNVPLQLCSESRFLLEFIIFIWSPSKDSKTKISIETKANTAVPPENIHSYLATVEEVFSRTIVGDISRVDYVNMCSIGDPIDRNCKHDINEFEESNNDHRGGDSKKAPMDVNNLVTIIGGVVTTLVAPVILLLIRNYIKNRPTKKPDSPRNPGDGKDDVDGSTDDVDDDDDDDDNDVSEESHEKGQSKSNLLKPPVHAFLIDDNQHIEKESTTKLLSSPRHSYFSDDGSFHSAASTLDIL